MAVTKTIEASLLACRLSKGCIKIISEAPEAITLKLFETVEDEVELRKINCNILGMAKGTKLKFVGHVHGDLKLHE